MKLNELPLYFDDFYRDPDCVRRAALAGNFKPTGCGFKGTQFLPRSMAIRPVLERIATLLGEPVAFASGRQGAFRLLTEAQEWTKTKHVHVDRMGLSGIICLSPDMIGETSFYRHKLTGLADLNNKRQVEGAAAQLGIRPAELLALLDLDGANLDRWVLVGRVPYRYNRMIIFDTNLFHAAGAGVGAEPHEAKLTQCFNFYPVGGIGPIARFVLGSRTHSLNAPAP